MMSINRRNFIRKTYLSTAALASSHLFSQSEDTSMDQLTLSGGRYMGGHAAPKLTNIRAAFIGLGSRGGLHLNFFEGLPGTEVVALSDLYEDNVKEKLRALKQMSSSSQFVNTATYWGDENKWRTMLQEVKPDVVFICTNWNNHAPMAIECMIQGAHAFVEVPLAVTLKDLWEIVDTSERTQKHCMMMENVNYGRAELMYLNMCRQGVIGELLHAEAAYIHELRGQMQQEDRGTGSWRTHHYATSRGNLYPTHGLGPVAQYMSLGRQEDNFKSLVSFSTPAMGRKLYAEKNYPPDHKWNQLDYQNGDLNTSMIKTHLGRTLMVQWDETSPRPYTRLNLIQGTRGTLAGYPTRMALEGGVLGITEDHLDWVEGEQLEKVYEKFDHPLYKRLNEKSKNSGHGGMDGIMMYRIVECLQKGKSLDQNVYEGAFWSSVSELSGRSIQQDGAPQSFPDFTRGKWKTTKPLEIIS
ncbi:MAG: alpha-N-acetylgalactosaminidase [Flavobacteriaceae bacterium TMED171]|nr:alpha-N-acetylgalactosaminidase [Flavobacteriaceae bacterium]OUW31368.1 MAG: alpha-N-acetylgalactosaminidase [Flavobacteriaceae bacterium TMED171]